MVQSNAEFLKILIFVELVFCNILNAYEPISAALLCRETNPVRILKLFELEERCFLFSLLVSLDIIHARATICCLQQFTSFMMYFIVLSFLIS